MTVVFQFDKLLSGLLDHPTCNWKPDIINDLKWMV